MASVPFNDGVQIGNSSYMHFFHESEKPNEPLPFPDTLENHDASYVSVTPERLAELEAKAEKWDKLNGPSGEVVRIDANELETMREKAAKWDAVSLLDQFEKAAKWDAIAPKLRYLTNFFNDLEGLKP